MVLHDSWDKSGASLLWTLHDLGWWNHDMLRFVVLGSSLTFVFGFLSGSFLVAVLKVRVDIFGDSINLFLQWRQALNSKKTLKFKI